LSEGKVAGGQRSPNMSATNLRVAAVLAHKGREVKTIDPEATVLDAIGAMARSNVGALVATDGARVVGLLSEREYTRGVELAGRPSRDTRVQDIMLTELPRVSPEPPIATGMAPMTEYRVRHLPVMAGEELVGLVSIGDLVAAVIRDQAQVIEQLELCIASG
jgi:CBS domain-containing protein